MIARDVATGYIGVLVVAALSLGPSFITHTAAAKMRARPRASTPAPIELPMHAHVAGISVPEPEPAPAPEPEPAEPVAKPKPPPPPKKKDELAEREANLLLLRAAVAAKREEIGVCRRPGGPEGRGEAQLAIGADGSIEVALSAPYASTAVGACIARRLGSAAIPFTGTPVVLRVAFEL
ncbi:MAG: hypothetical protein KIT84_17475 [Labilithrix sp.]|nr:hypothetical protein [Labilithrix sp.]MCW5812823.1 hypothetical protein [Labilithrix sp.]